MSRRKESVDLASRIYVRMPEYTARPVPCTPQERRRDIFSRFQLWRYGTPDESWVVLGEKSGTWGIKAPEEQRHILREQHRLRIAKSYGVPASHVMLEQEGANWRATRATAEHSGDLLIRLRWPAQTRVNVCLKIVAAIRVSRVGRS
jgi:hypothetical protein